MDKIDALARKYIKTWLGIQSRGVTDASIFHPYMLGVKMPSQVYLEAHAGNYAMVRLKGDPVVNHAIDSRLERESEWTQKHSTVNTMHTMWENNQEAINSVSHEEGPYNARKLKKAKKVMRQSVNDESLKYWNNKVKQLTFQGDFINLVIEEQQNVTWKSIANNVPKGVLSFALKSSVNGLNTPDNLKRWKIRQTNKCELCGNYGTLEHILNWCPKALKEGRFTWRHNSVLSHFTQELQKSKPSHIEIYADIPNKTLNGATIPPDVLVTTQRPDLVILDRAAKTIDILELTISFEKNIEAANARKSARYEDLCSDLRSAGWKTNLVPFEIGSRGQVTKRNKSAITKTTKAVHPQTDHKKLMSDLSKIALLCSFSIFQAHCQPAWQDPPFLHP
jgi:hypothetical protein